MAIEYVVAAAEEVDFPDNAFDAVTACQCFMYFDRQRLLPSLRRMLKPGGLLAILFMAWLPDEDKIAKQSEQLVLRYNPKWTGARWRRTDGSAPAWVAGSGFAVFRNDAFDVSVPFTRESWNGRMKACRGIGASLSAEDVVRFDREHLALLRDTAPESFEIAHEVTMLALKSDKA